jgi:hypothetical protein
MYVVKLNFSIFREYYAQCLWHPHRYLLTSFQNFITLNLKQESYLAVDNTICIPCAVDHPELVLPLRKKYLNHILLLGMNKLKSL